jgi:hypothetical protein
MIAKYILCVLKKLHRSMKDLTIFTLVEHIEFFVICFCQV